jgi:hypothetical protein
LYLAQHPADQGHDAEGATDRCAMLRRAQRIGPKTEFPRGRGHQEESRGAQRRTPSDDSAGFGQDLGEIA